VKTTFGKKTMKLKLTIIAIVICLAVGAFAPLFHKDDRNEPAKTPTGKILSPGAAWTNSLGMEFVPVLGLDVLFCKWETRVCDFEAFFEATGYDATKDLEYERSRAYGHEPYPDHHADTWHGPGFQQGPSHPVCCMNRDDARAFCNWLTKKEKEAGLLKSRDQYRLPSDAEWSVAVGLGVEKGDDVHEKSGKITDVFPWGRYWPPKEGDGNYGDISMSGQTNGLISGTTHIKGYNDGYARTSPVGSFQTNPFGLFDMGGNVWEWCEAPWTGRKRRDWTWLVLRGGGWQDAWSNASLSSARSIPLDPPDGRYNTVGFRVVLSVK
jgi:formylglycine-generating enzyme required for sulfatase activity